MQSIKESIKKEVEMKMLSQYKKLKDKILTLNNLSQGDEIPP